jgi:hypothetical protein
MLIIALLLSCLAFSLWLNFRLAKLVLFYGHAPSRPHAFEFAGRGVGYMLFPVVPILLGLMSRHYVKSPGNPTPAELRNLMCVGK